VSLPAAVRLRRAAEEWGCRRTSLVSTSPRTDRAHPRGRQLPLSGRHAGARQSATDRGRERVASSARTAAAR
jgi:hypothetical protein